MVAISDYPESLRADQQQVLASSKTLRDVFDSKLLQRRTKKKKKKKKKKKNRESIQPD
jgi:hypothetical protein